jgi:hypothetical protein
VLRVFLVDVTYELFRHYYAVPKDRGARGRFVSASSMPDFTTGSSVDPLAAAVIVETPVDEPGDEEPNVRVLKSLVESV